jgi:hypothetical protein
MILKLSTAERAALRIFCSFRRKRVIAPMRADAPARFELLRKRQRESTAEWFIGPIQRRED